MITGQMDWSVFRGFTMLHVATKYVKNVIYCNIYISTNLAQKITVTNNHGVIGLTSSITQPIYVTQLDTASSYEGRVWAVPLRPSAH